MSVIDERAPRRDLEAERAVLGTILLDPSALPIVADIARPGDFFHPGHGLIFETFEEMAERGEAIDIITLAAALRAKDRINTVGGAQYLGELTDSIATTAHVASHAAIVADEAQARAVVQLAYEMSARAGGGESAESLGEYLRSKASGIALPRQSDAFESLGDAVLRVIEKIEKSITTGRKSDGLTTGLRELDKITGGDLPGETIVLAARPGMGKTSLALKTAVGGALAAVQKALEDGNPAEAALPTLFFSLEMPTVELVQRMLCTEAKVDSNRLRANVLTQDEIDALFAAARALHPLPIYFDDRADLTLAQIHAGIRRMHRKHGGVARVIVDYLSLVKVEVRSASREQDISVISRRFKILAKEFGCPFTILAQLNRKCEERTDKRPVLSDLRESGSIEQDADKVIFIYCDDKYNPDSDDRGVAEIIVAKQRNGATGPVRVYFNRVFTRFDDLAVEMETIPASDPAAPLPGFEGTVFDG